LEAPKRVTRGDEMIPLLEFTKIIKENRVIFHCVSEGIQRFILEFNQGVCRILYQRPWTEGDKLSEYIYYNFLIHSCFQITKINDIEYVLDFRVYNHLQLSALKIMRYYRKYRYNLYKKRRDPLKKDLMEYYYHPKRLFKKLQK
jgi:hypothetical protein